MGTLFTSLVRVTNTHRSIMKTSTIIGIIVVIIVVVGGIYWYMQSAATQVSTTPTDIGTTPVPAASTLALGTDATLGSYLKATSGMTLYTYASDSAGTSTCSNDCATAWPPYEVTSADNLTADPGITGTLGTITREDGTLQVTYNGMPLYFYAQDVNPGDTNGQGVGGIWNVAKP